MHTRWTWVVWKLRRSSIVAWSTNHSAHEQRGHDRCTTTHASWEHQFEEHLGEETIKKSTQWLTNLEEVIYQPRSACNSDIQEGLEHDQVALVHGGAKSISWYLEKNCRATIRKWKEEEIVREQGGRKEEERVRRQIRWKEEEGVKQQSESKGE